MAKNAYLEKLAKNFKLNVHEEVLTKEQAMNYYVHQYNSDKKLWDGLSVNDIIVAAQMAGKQIRGNSLLEINVSFKEQLEYCKSDGRRNRKLKRGYIEQNQASIINNFLSGMKISKIAENLGCNRSTITRFLTKKGVRGKRVRKSKENINTQVAI